MDGDNPPQGGTRSVFKKCPKRNNQELSSGALRDEVDGDNLPEGGTGNGFRMCTKESGQKTQKKCPSPPSKSMKRVVTECESRKRKCKNLSQANKITPFLDSGINLNIKPRKKRCLRKTKSDKLIPDLK